MSKLYYVSLTPSGTANILMEMLANRNRSQSFESPCPLAISNVKGVNLPHIESTCWYVDEATTRFNSDFRVIDWTLDYPYLDSIVQRVQPKSIWIGTFLHESVTKIKKRYSDKVITISVNYTAEDYEFVFDKWANWQASYLITKQIKDFKLVDQAKEFCYTNGSTYFGYEIPIEKNTVADYTINIKDLYNQTKFEKFLNLLGHTASETDWNFYKEYIKYT